MPKICPKCASMTDVREVFYGMPDSEVDKSIYEVGGCCLPDEPTRYVCKSCGWRETGVLTNGLEWV